MPGATVVNTFAQGVAALKAGKQIRYEGPGGPTSFDAYHDSAGLFQVDRYTSNGTVKVTATSTSAMRALGLTVSSCSAPRTVGLGDGSSTEAGGVSA